MRTGYASPSLVAVPDGADHVTTYGAMLDVKFRIYDDLGQPALEVATFLQAEEDFAAAERKGLVNAHGHDIWREMISNAAFAYFSAHQLETAKRYFLRALAMPELDAIGRVTVIQGMARYHKERKEWVEMTMCLQVYLHPLLESSKRDVKDEVSQRCFMFLCSEFLSATHAKMDTVNKAFLYTPPLHMLRKPSLFSRNLRSLLSVFQNTRVDKKGNAERRIFLLLADAAEGQGNLMLAHEYDQKAKKIWLENDIYCAELEASNRRTATELLAKGRTHEAVQLLEHVPFAYVEMLRNVGINLTELRLLKPIMAALKVLAAAMVQTGCKRGI